MLSHSDHLGFTIAVDTLLMGVFLRVNPSALSGYQRVFSSFL
jgi:hypothetical protein